MEVTKQVVKNIHYACELAFDLADKNDFVGIESVAKKGGLSMIVDGNRRDIFFKLDRTGPQIQILRKAAMNARQSLIDHNYDDSIKTLVREYDMMTLESTQPHIPTGAKIETPVEKVIEKQQLIICPNCKKESGFTNDILTSMNPDNDVKLNCEYCDTIVAIVKTKKKWIKYKAEVLVENEDAEIILIEAIDEDHAYSKLGKKGFSKDKIVSLVDLARKDEEITDSTEGLEFPETEEIDEDREPSAEEQSEADNLLNKKEGGSLDGLSID